MKIRTDYVVKEINNFGVRKQCLAKTLVKIGFEIMSFLPF